MTADFWPSAVKLSGSLSQRCVSSPLPPNPCEMEFDDLAKQQSDRIFQMWIQNLLGNSPEGLVRKLASRHYPGSTPETASRLSNGAFNVCYRVTFENGRRVVVRFDDLGRVVTCNEKVEDEVTIIQYVA